MGILACPLFFIFVFFPDSAMSLFGEQFSKGGVVLAILAVGEFINVLTGSAGILLMMSGHEKAVRNNTFIAIILLAVLCLVLIPTIGLVGAAISVASAIIMKNLIALFLVWKYLGISIYVKKPLAISDNV